MSTLTPYLARWSLMCTLLLILAGCASPQLDTSGGNKGLSMERALILSEARGSLGTPYRFGGNDPRGLDCSGLVQMAYSRGRHQCPPVLTGAISPIAGD